MATPNSEQPNIKVPKMPMYQSHKQVRALRIADYILLDRILIFVDKRYPAIQIDEKMVARYEPKPGDYYVVYPDGYAAISPAEAFESGYTLLQEYPYPTKFTSAALIKAAADEPIFVLRGRDAFAAWTIEQWANQAQSLQVPANKVESAKEIAGAIRVWQAVNGCKRPD